MIAEGATAADSDVVHTGAELDAFGHVQLKGVGLTLEKDLQDRIPDLASRVTVLGHLLRGGTPTAYDRILSTRYGLRAARAVKDGEWGKMVALRGNEIVTVDLSEATEETKTVPDDLYDAAHTFFG